ncbi:MAG: hypothetical protein JRH20_32085 [Deltaproteobacteria bacterium]|nr:hypothetical protein [Deltaproteobacteria bacterium]
MQKYHNEDLSSLTSFAKLQELLERRRSQPVSELEPFEAYERELGERMREVECELNAAELARYDVEADAIVVDGQEFRKVLAKEPKTYQCSSGPVTVERNLFRPKGGGKCTCALDLRAGIVGGLCTPLLARQVGFLMGHMTSLATTQVFKEFGIDGPSQSSCDRLPKILSAEWETHRESWEEELRSKETVAGEATLVAVSLDGVMVPDKEAQRQAKAAREEAKKKLKKKPTGPAGYREVGCGTISLYAPGEDGPQRLDTIRYGRAPERKKKTLTEQLDAELNAILAARSDLHLVALADGAEENWRYFEGAQWEKATKIVDNGHANEHLRNAMSAFYGKDSVRGRAEYERLRVILKDEVGGVNEVIAELKRFGRKMPKNASKTRSEELRKERKYFTNQRERMNYDRYQELGLPIGSGVVEAACKTIAAQRLKLSGMSWGDGKQGILTIRSLQQSDRWERGWSLLAAAFRRDVYQVQEHGHLCCYEKTS